MRSSFVRGQCSPYRLDMKNRDEILTVLGAHRAELERSDKGCSATVNLHIFIDRNVPSAQTR
jgi:hypothetical protein